MSDRIKITLRGLPHVDGDLSFWTETPEDGVMVLINDRPIVAVDLMYSGLRLEDDLPIDPADPDNTPKVVVGAWPDGEEWERILTVPMNDVPIPCDVVEGCTEPTIDCIGGEIWYCAKHEAQSGEAYEVWRASPERAARVAARKEQR